MTEEHRTAATIAARSNPLVRAAQVLGLGFITLASMLIAPFALVIGWLRRSPVPRDLGHMAEQLPLHQPTTSVAPHAEGPQELQVRASSARAVLPEFESIVVEPEFDELRIRALLGELHRPGSKLLDLRAVRTIQFRLFARLD